MSYILSQILAVIALLSIFMGLFLSVFLAVSWLLQKVHRGAGQFVVMSASLMVLFGVLGCFWKNTELSQFLYQMLADHPPMTKIAGGLSIFIFPISTWFIFGNLVRTSRSISNRSKLLRYCCLIHVMATPLVISIFPISIAYLSSILD